MRKSLLIVALAAAGFTTASAHAGNATFYSLIPGQSNSYSFTDSDGIGITATADSSNTQKNPKVTQGWLGLGVNSRSSLTYQNHHLTYQNDSQSSQISDNDFSETLWLSFDQNVVINTLGLSNVGSLFGLSYQGSDGYRLVDANGLELASGTISGNSLGLAELSLSSLGALNKIGIQAMNTQGRNCRTDYSAFNVASLGVTAIPLPAAAWSGLGMFGLLGAGALRKKGLALLRAC